VVVTTGAIGRAKFQYIINTNEPTPTVLQANQQRQSTEGKVTDT